MCILKQLQSFSGYLAIIQEVTTNDKPQKFRTRSLITVYYLTGQRKKKLDKI